MELLKDKKSKETFWQLKDYAPIREEDKQEKYGFLEQPFLLAKRVVRKDLSVVLFDGFKVEFKEEFKEKDPIVQEIKKSVEILKLKNNWDGEGSKRYSKETLKNALGFLVNYVNWIWDEKGTCIPSPRILPGPDGSIDLFWKRNNYDLLINIPESPNTTANFYGDNNIKSHNTRVKKIKGEFSLEENDMGIFMSLLSLD